MPTWQANGGHVADLRHQLFSILKVSVLNERLGDLPLIDGSDIVTFALLTEHIFIERSSLMVRRESAVRFGADPDRYR